MQSDMYFALHPKKHIDNIKFEPGTKFLIAIEENLNGKIEFVSYLVDVNGSENESSCVLISNFSERTTLTTDFVKENFYETGKGLVGKINTESGPIECPYYYLY